MSTSAMPAANPKAIAKPLADEELDAESAVEGLGAVEGRTTWTGALDTMPTPPPGIRSMPTRV
jgi:hypothetical protein